MLLCKQAAAALTASVTTVGTAVMACTGLTVTTLACTRYNSQLMTRAEQLYSTALQ